MCSVVRQSSELKKVEDSAIIARIYEPENI